MQKDLHYAALRVIAEKAGFKPRQAQLIAYASDFVDDAVEHKPLKIPQRYKNLNCKNLRFKGDFFDPVCTAHKGLQFLKDFKKEVQEKIYISFHFIPTQIYKQQTDYSYITQADSPFAQLLLKRALKYLKIERNSKNLIRLGVALHTYMDSFSHDGFSGIFSYADNNIDQIELYNGKELKHINLFNQLKNNLFPPIGHAQAYEYPDLPFLRWSYIKPVNPNKRILRNNSIIFYKALKKVYYILCNFNNCHNNWKDIKELIWKALNFISYNVDHRVDFYKRIFPEINFFYNERLWKDDILNPPQFSDKSIKLKPKTYWFLFHQVALEQRNFVLKNIKHL